MVETKRERNGIRMRTVDDIKEENFFSNDQEDIGTISLYCLGWMLQQNPLFLQYATNNYCSSNSGFPKHVIKTLLAHGSRSISFRTSLTGEEQNHHLNNLQVLQPCNKLLLVITHNKTKWTRMS